MLKIAIIHVNLVHTHSLGNTMLQGPKAKVTFLASAHHISPKLSQGTTDWEDKRANLSSCPQHLNIPGGM